MGWERVHRMGGTGVKEWIMGMMGYIIVVTSDGVGYGFWSLYY